MVAEIEIQGLAEVEARLKSDLFGKPLASMLSDLAKVGQRAAKAGAPAHVQIRRSTQTLTAKVRAVSPRGDAATQEIGRQPGAKMPPESALAVWMATKGIPQELTFVIARAIKRRGSKGRFFMVRAESAIEDAMPERVERMAREIEGAW